MSRDAVIQAVEDGEISESRYFSYVSMFEEGREIPEINRDVFLLSGHKNLECFCVGLYIIV